MAVLAEKWRSSWKWVTTPSRLARRAYSRLSPSGRHGTEPSEGRERRKRDPRVQRRRALRSVPAGLCERRALTPLAGVSYAWRLKAQHVESWYAGPRNLGVWCRGCESSGCSMNGTVKPFDGFKRLEVAAKAEADRVVAESSRVV